MNDIVVFLGPSLDLEEATSILPATYVPPVAAGDVYRAVALRPRAIGIVDGLFNSRLSVWHKEILYAMHQGIPVFGASSMGALRAAELDQFGMVGVGVVYEHFASDDITDDDEVAVSHLGADEGWRPLSVAMVNIRATLAAAVTQGIIDPHTEGRLVSMAKGRFYPDRTYATLFADARSAGVAAADIDALRSWLAGGGAVEQKRADAIALLERLARLDHEPAPPAGGFPFERTGYWEALRASIDNRPELLDAEAVGVSVTDSLVLDELALDPQREVVALRGLVQALAERLGELQAHPFDRDSLVAVAEGVWHEHGLTDDAALRAWIEDRRLTDDEARDLVRGEAHRQWGETFIRHRAARATLDQLKLSREYPRLRQRAEDKQSKLRDAGLSGLGSAVGCSDDDLWAWFNVRCGNRFSDPEAAAKALGFSTPEKLRRALVAEYHYAGLC